MQTYVTAQEAEGQAYDQRGPEDVQTQQNHQQPVKEVISEERRVQGHGIHPGAIHDPERNTRTMWHKHELIILYSITHSHTVQFFSIKPFSALIHFCTMYNHAYIHRNTPRLYHNHIWRGMFDDSMCVWRETQRETDGVCTGKGRWWGVWRWRSQQTGWRCSCMRSSIWRS